MRFEDCAKFDQTFTHISNDGEVTVINASMVNRWAEKANLEVVMVEVDPTLADVFQRKGGVSAVNASRVPDSRLLNPITLIEWGDTTQTLIDGNHRYVRAAQLGIKLLRAWFIPEHGWRPFVIDEIPPEVFNFLIHDVTETARAHSNR